MTKTIRTVVIQGDDEVVTLRQLLDAIDVVAGEAPDTATVRVHTQPIGGNGVWDVFFGPSGSTDEPNAKWRVAARWDETDKGEPEKAAPAEGAEK